MDTKVPNTVLVWIQKYLPQYWVGYKDTYHISTMDTKVPTTVLVWIVWIFSLVSRCRIVS